MCDCLSNTMAHKPIKKHWTAQPVNSRYLVTKIKWEMHLVQKALPTED